MDSNKQAEIVEDKSAHSTEPVPNDEQPQGPETITQEAGINMEPEKPIQTKQELDERDRQRWELNPDSKTNQ